MPSRERTTLSAAVVGAGLMGRWHADAIRRAGGVVTAVVDPDEARAVALAKRYGSAKAFHRLDDVLNEARPAVVHLCTPANLHRQQAEQALKSGAHVFIEKPLAQNLKDTQEIISLAEQNKRLVCPVHQFVFQDGVQRLHKWISADGELTQVSFTIHSAGGVGSPSHEFDALVADILPHPLSLLQFLLPGSLDAAWTVHRPAPGELRVMGVDHKRGSAGIGLTIEISMNARPTQNTLSVAARNASFHVDIFHGFAFRSPGTVSRARKIIQPFEFSLRQFGAATGNLAMRALNNESAYPGLRRLVSLFYKAIRTGEPSPISPHDALAIARARQTILTS